MYFNNNKPKGKRYEILEYEIQHIIKNDFDRNDSVEIIESEME